MEDEIILKLTRKELMAIENALSHVNDRLDDGDIARFIEVTPDEWEFLQQKVADVVQDVKAHS